MKLSLKYFLSLCLVMILSNLQAQEFSISVNAREIGRKDHLQVNYDISGEGKVSDFQLPFFGKQWKIVSGPQSGFQSMNINGNKSTITSYIYILSPTRTGKLSIPATSVKVNGRSMSCKEIAVNVVKEDHLDDVPSAYAQSPTIIDIGGERKEDIEEVELKPGENPQKKIRNNLFVKVIPSKRKCYVGEPVLVTYKLYTRLRSDSRVVKQPSFSGCTVTEMTTDQVDKGIEVINGKKYKAYLFRQVQLFPLQPGRITVGEASVDNTVTFLSSSSDFRDMYYGIKSSQEHNITLSTEPFFIEVLALPGKDKTGGIGNFAITTTLKKDSIAANETNTLIVTVRGKGNFNSIAEPEITWPKDVYHFDAVERDSIDRLSFPLAGIKVYEIPFEAGNTGKLEIPSVSLNYFDPEKAKYISVKSEPLHLTVTPAIKANLVQSTFGTKEGFDIKYLFYALPVIFLAGLFFIAKQSRKKLQPVIAQNAVIAEEVEHSHEVFNATAELNELMLLQDDAAFYSQAKKIAKQLLEENKGDSSLLLEIIQQCNTVLFTPIHSTSKKEILEKLQQAII